MPITGFIKWTGTVKTFQFQGISYHIFGLMNTKGIIKPQKVKNVIFI